MDSKFNLTFSQLKAEAYFTGSDATVHRYRELDLLKHQRKNGRCFYSEESVVQLRLIPEFKKYSFQIKHIKETFEHVPLDVLEKSVGKISPDDLFNLIASYKSDQMVLPFPGS